MNIIQVNADILSGILKEKKKADFSTLLTASKFNDVELWAAIGWIACEGRLDTACETVNGNTILLFSLFDQTVDTL